MILTKVYKGADNRCKIYKGSLLVYDFCAPTIALPTDIGLSEILVPDIPQNIILEELFDVVIPDIPQNIILLQEFDNAPGVVVLTLDTFDDTSADISWSDPVIGTNPIAYWEYFVNNVLYGVSVDGTIRLDTIIGLVPETPYVVKIRAVDNQGLTGGYSNYISFSTEPIPVVIPSIPSAINLLEILLADIPSNIFLQEISPIPLIPTGILLENIVSLNAPTIIYVQSTPTTIEVNWTGINSGAIAATVAWKSVRSTRWIEGNQNTGAIEGPRTIGDRQPDTSYDFRVRYEYSGGVVGPWSNVIEATTTSDVSDTEPPTAPTSFSLIYAEPNRFLLQWSGATDNVGVIGYNVYIDGVISGFTSIESITIDNKGGAPLLHGTHYDIAIESVDAAGNVSLSRLELINEYTTYWHLDIAPAGVNLSSTRCQNDGVDFLLRMSDAADTFEWFRALDPSTVLQTTSTYWLVGLSIPTRTTTYGCRMYYSGVLSGTFYVTVTIETCN